MYSPQLIDLAIAQATWKPLGSGTYNDVSISEGPVLIGEYPTATRWVLKIPKPHDNKRVNRPERAVEVWNQLNPQYPAYAATDGWIAPYLGETPATDKEIADSLLHIYREHKRIITDAPGHHNFLRVNGEVVCVDVDLALRRGSPASEEFYDGDIGLQSHHEWWKEQAQTHPLSVEIIKALLYLEQHLSPKDIPNEFLRADVLTRLQQLRRNSDPITLETLKMVAKIADNHPTLEIKFIDAELLAELLNLEQHHMPINKNSIRDSISVHAYARCGELEQVKQLIRRNKNLVDATMGSPPVTALSIAAFHGQKKTVQYLLGHGAAVNPLAKSPKRLKTHDDEAPEHFYPLDYAISGGHLKTMEVLEWAGALSNSNVKHVKIRGRKLHVLVQLNQLEHVKILIKYNPELLDSFDDEGHTALHIAAHFGHLKMLDFLISNMEDLNTPTKLTHQTALELALEQGKTHELVALRLIAAGAELPTALEDKIHPIHLCTKHGLVKEMKTMVKKDPSLAYAKDPAGQTPMFYAAAYGRIHALNYLLNQGQSFQDTINLDPSHPNYQTLQNASPIDYAYMQGQTDIIRILMDKGALPKFQHKTIGKKTLWHVIKEGDLQSIKFLVSQNKKLLLHQDSLGRTPLQFAQENDKDYIVNYFKKETPQTEMSHLSKQTTFFQTPPDETKITTASKQTPGGP